MSLSSHKNRLIRITPNAGNPSVSGFGPSVARIQNGDDRVYWGPQQPIQIAEPPGYAPPPGWPVVNTLITPPRCCRMFLINPGQTVYFNVIGTHDGDPLTTSTTPYCPDAPLNAITPLVLNPAYVQVADTLPTYFGSTFSVADAQAALDSIGTDYVVTSISPANLGFWPNQQNDNPASLPAWQAALSTIAAAIAPVDLYGQTVQPPFLYGTGEDADRVYNYLTWASVDQLYVPIPGSSAPFPFVAGRMMVIIVFCDNDSPFAYDSGGPFTAGNSVGINTAGQRIVDCLNVYPTQPAFPDFQLLLVGDSALIAANPATATYLQAQVATIQAAMTNLNPTQQNNYCQYLTSDPTNPSSIIGVINAFFS